jgi:hypothetical protein
MPCDLPEKSKVPFFISERPHDLFHEKYSLKILAGVDQVIFGSVAGDKETGRFTA